MISALSVSISCFFSTTRCSRSFNSASARIISLTLLTRTSSQVPPPVNGRRRRRRLLLVREALGRGALVAGGRVDLAVGAIIVARGHHRGARVGRAGALRLECTASSRPAARTSPRCPPSACTRRCQSTRARRSPTGPPARSRTPSRRTRASTGTGPSRFGFIPAAFHAHFAMQDVVVRHARLDVAHRRALAFSPPCTRDRPRRRGAGLDGLRRLLRLVRAADRPTPSSEGRHGLHDHAPVHWNSHGLMPAASPSILFSRSHLAVHLFMTSRSRRR